ncbi:MAG: DUF1684 domain-containing protein [Actinomycetota bacterium]|nr:DUF1684 domain-containing protein [Actinomycetota bacterium]
MDATTLREYRSNKDEHFGNDHHSPIPATHRERFNGLAYYDWNADLALTVPVGPGDGAPITIATSDGAERIYHRAGTVELTVAGEGVSLSLYDTGHPGYFLPFRDSTSGKETYGGGRYLDLDPNEDGTVTIDFNLAYNPFCAYNDAYSCALPPVENWLSVPIEAGEQVWDKPA